MTHREQRESLVLGVIAGGLVAMLIVFLVSLALVLGDDDVDSPIPGSAGVATSTAADTTSGFGQGQGLGQGQGGPPDGRGPGVNGQTTSNPLASGTASDDVIAAFDAGTCVACHSVKGVGGGEATVGPPLFRTGAIAAERRPGPSVEAYIKESITDPDAFIMPNCPNGPCPSGVMPKTLAETLSVEQIETIVNYLAALGTDNETSVLSP